MKRILALGLLLTAFFTLSGCRPAAPIAPSGAANETQETISLRIVDGAETGQLVLAGTDASEVYTLNASSVPVFLDGSPADVSVLEDGMMAEITFDGNILTTWPARLGAISAFSVYSLGTEQNPGGGLYDLCGLYLQVLEDLWEKDSGLNGGAKYLNVNLTDAPGHLTAGERAAIAWIFAGAHNAEPLTLSMEELIREGYLTEYTFGEPSERPASEPEHKVYTWEDGVSFTISAHETDGEEVHSLAAIRFNAEKWRSPLGAYFFHNCTALWPQMGPWSSYTVESELIA